MGQQPVCDTARRSVLPVHCIPLRTQSAGKPAQLLRAVNGLSLPRTHPGEADGTDRRAELLHPLLRDWSLLLPASPATHVALLKACHGSACAASFLWPSPQGEARRGNLGAQRGEMFARGQHNFTLYGGDGWEAVNALVLD